MNSNAIIMSIFRSKKGNDGNMPVIIWIIIFLLLAVILIFWMKGAFSSSMFSKILGKMTGSG